MVYYKQMGKIPRKRHTVFKNNQGQLYKEQVMGTKGFSGVESILYHHYVPLEFKKVALSKKLENPFENVITLSHRHFLSFKWKQDQDGVLGRRYILGNEDLQIGICHPAKKMDYYYRNGDGDELLFVHYGKGTIQTMFGNLTYRPGDYIVIPIGTVYKIIPNECDSKFLVIESNGAISLPKRYRNEWGQLLEHSPFCERDIRTPERLETFTEKGEFEIKTKARHYIHSHILNHHPFDVIGWDGYLYPYIFNIEDFEPITGRIHMPPPIHQTFEGNNFVVCSFVPRLYDYHPEAIPAPYYHSNVNSDEVLYYVKGNFMSRKGIEEGSITLHPSGIPHGPHPGTIEASIGKRETIELAVMIDTFKPLNVYEKAQEIEDQDYKFSWIADN